jgi:hypothetical protein
MKTRQLIKLLTTGEREEFAHQLAIIKNKKTLLAYQYLVKEQVEEEDLMQEKLFKKLFSKNWTKKDDYLLRNEFRLLNKQLELFFAFQKMKQTNSEHEAETNWLYLNLLLDRESWHLFEKELERETRRCEEEGHWRALVRLGELNVEYTIRRREFSPEGLSHLLDALMELDLLAQRLHAHRVSELRLYRAQISRQRSETDPGFELIEQTTAEYRIDWEKDPFLGYAEYARKAYYTRGEETVIHMRKALDYMLKCRPREVQQKRVSTYLRAQIALEYFLRKDYEQAHEFYSAVLPHASDVNDGNRLCAIYLNYISNLIRLTRYEEVLKFIEKEEKLFNHFKEFRERIACLRAICCIYTGKLKEGRKYISEEIAEARQDTLIYLRMCLGIIYYLQAKNDMALREMNNLMQSLRNADLRYERYLHALRIFARFLEIEMKVDAERASRQLRKDLNLFIDKEKQMFEIMPVQWIINCVDKAI